MTAAHIADGITVSWRWNDSNSSVLTCVRSIRIIYKPVGGKEERLDVNKFRTTHTFPKWQCNMGCAITVNTLGVNGEITSKTCTTSGRTHNTVSLAHVLYLLPVQVTAAPTIYM